MKRKIDVKELQQIELDILKYIHELCETEGLKYFLAGGSMLGAIRHKGFIPWDDDIDILMPRRDYERLIQRLGRKNGRYKIVTCYNTKNYLYPFAKVIDSRTRLVEKHETRCPLGVYIDVFAYDGLPDKATKTYQKHIKKCMSLQKFRWFSYFPFREMASDKWYKNVLRYPLWLALRIIGGQRIAKYIDKVAKLYDVDTSGFVGCIYAGYGEREIVHYESYAKTMDVLFEGQYFKAPVGYEEYLSNLYGDYMQLPPPEKRKSHHVFKAWWLD